MPKTPPYCEQFRREAVQLLRRGDRVYGSPRIHAQLVLATASVSVASAWNG